MADNFDLVTKYSPKVDELFKAESKSALVTNTDYDFDGSHTVKVYKLSTAPMNDYKRTLGTNDNPISRYGNIRDLEGSTETMTLKKDRSFIYNMDTLDMDETAGALDPGTSLARQVREVIVPERDKYIYGVMAANAGFKDSKEKAGFKYYDAIIEAGMKMDEAEVPDNERVLVLSAEGYKDLKKELSTPTATEVDAEMRKSGVIGYLDGMPVVKVPSSYLPDNFAFMIAHPSATVAPQKLNELGAYPGEWHTSGYVVAGRIVYDAFVLDNKKKGIFVQSFTETQAG